MRRGEHLARHVVVDERRRCDHACRHRRAATPPSSRSSPHPTAPTSGRPRTTTRSPSTGSHRAGRCRSRTTGRRPVRAPENSGLSAECRPCAETWKTSTSEASWPTRSAVGVVTRRALSAPDHALTARSTSSSARSTRGPATSPATRGDRGTSPSRQPRRRRPRDGERSTGQARQHVHGTPASDARGNDDDRPVTRPVTQGLRPAGRRDRASRWRACC